MSEENEWQICYRLPYVFLIDGTCSYGALMMRIIKGKKQYRRLIEKDDELLNNQRK